MQIKFAQIVRTIRSSVSGEEHCEHKFDDSDSNLHTLSGDIPDSSEATFIFCERIFSVVKHTKFVGERKGCIYRSLYK